MFLRSLPLEGNNNVFVTLPKCVAPLSPAIRSRKVCVLQPDDQLRYSIHLGDWRVLMTSFSHMLSGY